MGKFSALGISVLILGGACATGLLFSTVLRFNLFSVLFI